MQAQEATRSKDPLTTATAFNSLAVPAGHATQLVACDLRFCLAECSGPAATDAGR
jgi:hypothetical protein